MLQGLSVGLQGAPLRPSLRAQMQPRGPQGPRQEVGLPAGLSVPRGHSYTPGGDVPPRPCGKTPRERGPRLQVKYLSEGSSALPEKKVVTSRQPLLPAPWTWKGRRRQLSGALVHSTHGLSLKVPERLRTTSSMAEPRAPTVPRIPPGGGRWPGPPVGTAAPGDGEQVKAPAAPPEPRGGRHSPGKGQRQQNKKKKKRQVSG